MTTGPKDNTQIDEELRRLISGVQQQDEPRSEPDIASDELEDLPPVSETELVHDVVEGYKFRLEKLKSKLEEAPTYANLNAYGLLLSRIQNEVSRNRDLLNYGEVKELIRHVSEEKERIVSDATPRFDPPEIPNQPVGQQEEVAENKSAEEASAQTPVGELLRKQADWEQSKADELVSLNPNQDELDEWTSIGSRLEDNAKNLLSADTEYMYPIVNNQLMEEVNALIDSVKKRKEDEAKARELPEAKRGRGMALSTVAALAGALYLGGAYHNMRSQEDLASTKKPIRPVEPVADSQVPQKGNRVPIKVVPPKNTEIAESGEDGARETTSASIKPSHATTRSAEDSAKTTLASEPLDKWAEPELPWTNGAEPQKPTTSKPFATITTLPQIEQEKESDILRDVFQKAKNLYNTDAGTIDDSEWDQKLDTSVIELTMRRDGKGKSTEPLGELLSGFIDMSNLRPSMNETAREFITRVFTPESK